MTENQLFDLWNGQKKILHSASVSIKAFPQKRDVWMTSLGKNVGFEQNGSGYYFFRPVLVIKKFNNHMFWILPLSTKQKTLDFYYNFTDPFGRKAAIIVSQLRLLSIKRFRRKMYKFDDIEFHRTQAFLYELLEDEESKSKPSL